MMDFIFIFTAAMIIVASFKLVGLAFGNGITLPQLHPAVFGVVLVPDSWLIFYPSLMYQVAFWSYKLGVLQSL